MRVEGWRDRLTVTIAAHQARPFAWGAHDCATFWRDCARAITGVDYLADAPAWCGPLSAVRALHALGFETCEALVAARLVEIAPGDVEHGDLVYPVGPAARLMGPAVVLGTSMMSRNPSGFVVLRLALARRAFRVG